MPEPTVLDYFKAKITFWRPSDLHFPDSETVEETQSARIKETPVAQPTYESVGEITAVSTAKPPPPLETYNVIEDLQVEYARVSVVETQLPEPHRLVPGGFPWRVALALLVALTAQVSLLGPGRSAKTGAALYFIAAVLGAWGILQREWALPLIPVQETSRDGLLVRLSWLVAACLMGALTFLIFTPGMFTAFTLVIWFITIACFVFAFWAPTSGGLLISIRNFFANRWKISITPFTGLLLGAFLVAVFFRAYHLTQVPPEMISDHAEKLLDVNDVLNGHTSVFFPRNTGREFFQFYLTAGIILLFKTGVSFLSLKIGTISMGLLTLPFIYLIGKELGNKRVGLIALFFAGIAYWPNVFSRIGLRFTLYPAFAAPALYFLLRGIRRRRRNDFIFAGLFLGLGLNGYTSYRIMPLVVIAAVGLYLLHRQSQGDRQQAAFNLVVTGAVSFAVFLPLLRYATVNPEMFSYRALTRIGTLEHPIPGSPIAIFFSNLWNACTMFFWSDGDVWVHSIPYRPALDTVTSGLFFLGLVLLITRYLRQRNWSDLFLIVSIPLMMLPSILSLAFPNENPSLNRTSGAIIPVFIVVAFAMEALYVSLKDRIGGNFGKTSAWVVSLALVLFSVQQNYQLVFKDYATLYQNSSWNSSEMSQVIRGFIDSVGSPDRVWVIPYPYWVDTRVIGINAGYPAWDTALDKSKIPETSSVPGMKLFILNMEDKEALNNLEVTYPTGKLWEYPSKVPTKDFYVYLTPQ